MPPESVWAEFPVIAILILAAAVIALAFYRLWHELLEWIEKQDKKRELERETQRQWEAEQAKARDLRWQEFMAQMQSDWLTQDGKNAAVLEKLIGKIENLTNAVNNHDTWARASDKK